MTLDEFWTIVERVHAASPRDMGAKCRLLEDEMRRLPPDEVQSFANHFIDCRCRLWTYDVLAAANIITDCVCGDDSFTDFRSTLISVGRAPFEAAITDADGLAEFDIDPEWATYEGYQYVAWTVYEEMTGHEVTYTASCPPQNRGLPLKEWELSKRFPRLAAKYGYDDAAWLYLKDLEEKRAKDNQRFQDLATLMLKSGIIPASGLIPTFRIVAPALRSGRSPQSTGRTHTWEPYELDELSYWCVVKRLERMTADDLKRLRPDLEVVNLRSDVDLGVGLVHPFPKSKIAIKNQKSPVAKQDNPFVLH